MGFYDEEKWVHWVDRISDKGFVVIDDFLPGELYSGLREHFLLHLHKDDFQKAGIGDASSLVVRQEIRGDHILWLERDTDPVTDRFLELADEAKAMFNRYGFLSLADHEFHLAHYPPGSFYKKHLDQFRDRNNRMITMIIYLNRNWKEGNGGELRIYPGEQTMDIQPIENRCVIFRSNLLPHEVLKTKVARYSLTGWLLYKPSGLGGLMAR